MRTCRSTLGSHAVAERAGPATFRRPAQAQTSSALSARARLARGAGGPGPYPPVLLRRGLRGPGGAAMAAHIFVAGHRLLTGRTYAREAGVAYGSAPPRSDTMALRSQGASPGGGVYLVRISAVPAQRAAGEASETRVAALASRRGASSITLPVPLRSRVGLAAMRRAMTRTSAATSRSSSRPSMFIGQLRRSGSRAKSRPRPQLPANLGEEPGRTTGGDRLRQ